ncbi:MAG: ribosome silencing factor [Candidatus Saccharicenans sp.]|jgi:ribosome-associated protein|nr:ribosome silencing factor [Candidatus Saccharicenans sp.]MDH7492933.1 ribosome silencing factor [Candidatus Saccharicenans sp.]
MAETKDRLKKFTKRSLPREVRLSIKASLAKKAEDLCVLDLRELTSFTDFFIIMHGNSSRQNVAIYESIEEELSREKIKPFGIEGLETAEWILLDYGSFVVHIFSKRARDFYSLEKLWADAPRLDY